jgi:hypothetical protein
MKEFFSYQVLTVWKYTGRTFRQTFQKVRDLLAVLFQVLRFKNDDFDLE